MDGETNVSADHKPLNNALTGKIIKVTVEQKSAKRDMDKPLKALLVASALAELGAGVALVVAPSKLAQLLVGAPIHSPPAMVVARIAGAALLALAAVCWLARDDVTSRAVRGIVAGMLLYNCGSVAVLLYAATSGLRGAGLWPTLGLHALLAGWCVATLIHRSNGKRDALDVS